MRKTSLTLGAVVLVTGILAGCETTPRYTEQRYSPMPQATVTSGSGGGQAQQQDAMSRLIELQERQTRAAERAAKAAEQQAHTGSSEAGMRALQRAADWAANPRW